MFFQKIYIDKLENFYETVTLRKNRSGLPVNLYLDDSMSYLRKRRRKIVKFQTEKGDHPFDRDFPSMTIEDNPQIFCKNKALTKKIKLSSEEIDQIKSFVKNNKEFLYHLADMDIDFFDFLKVMRR